MRTLMAVSAFFFLGISACQAQVSGNIAFGQGGGRLRAEQAERSKRVLSESEKPAPGSMFVDASVLMNVKADEHVAVFAVAQEGSTVAECNQKLNATLKDFSAALQPLGVNDVFVDFVSQNKIYGYQVEDRVAREKLAGFNLKKNVSLRYKDGKTLDRILIAAAGHQIFDLVKVDYLVKDHEAVQNKLIEEAARIIHAKAARHEKLLGIKLAPAPQVNVEKTSVYYPTEMYDSYVAQETEHIDPPFERGKYFIQGARKSHTFYYNPLTANGFDAVVQPLISEPVVQFTVYVRVRFDMVPKK